LNWPDTITSGRWYGEWSGVYSPTPPFFVAYRQPKTLLKKVSERKQVETKKKKEKALLVALVTIGGLNSQV
jgi:hypothetical protein